jgi:hypothetical protein
MGPAMGSDILIVTGGEVGEAVLVRRGSQFVIVKLVL